MKADQHGRAAPQIQHQDPRAVGYDGDDEFATPTVSAAEFASIYENFGYR